MLSCRAAGLMLQMLCSNYPTIVRGATQKATVVI
jgi:hypothetical protein